MEWIDGLAASTAVAALEQSIAQVHEVRALSLHLYQKAAKDGQKIADETTPKSSDRKQFKN